MIKNKSFPSLVKRTAAALVFMALILAAPHARAHARLTRSVPEAGTNSFPSPRQIDLWFNELLDGGDFNSITVYATAEANAKPRTDFIKGKAQVDAKDRTHLTVAIKPLRPGEYTVEWRVLSLDGHTAPGRYKFKVSK